MGETYMVHSKDEYLQHFKYIKRERKNGKWRYYYDVKSNKLSQLKSNRDKIQAESDRNYANYQNNIRRADLKRARDSGDQDAIDNTNRYYSKLDYQMKDAWESGNYGKDSTYGKTSRETYRELYDAKNNVARRESQAGGKVDSFMEKHGESIANAMNMPSESKERAHKYISKHLSKAKNWVYVYKETQQKKKKDKPDMVLSDGVEVRFIK